MNVGWKKERGAAPILDIDGHGAPPLPINSQPVAGALVPPTLVVPGGIDHEEFPVAGPMPGAMAGDALRAFPERQGGIIVLSGVAP